MSLISGFVTGIGSSFASSLFGGSSKGGGNEVSDIIRAQQEEQEREDDIAGFAAQKSTIESPGQIPTTAERLAGQLGEFGNEMAGDFVEKLSSRFIDQKISSIFAPKKVSPIVRGAQDRAYTTARFPGVNPWELAGGGAASGGQGGRAAPSIQRKTAEETARTSARAQERSATITTAPKIEEVNIKYQKLHPEIDQIKAETGLKGTQTRLVGHQANIEEIKQDWQHDLSETEIKLKKSMGQQIDQKTKLEAQQTLNEMQKHPLIKSNAKIQAVLAEYATALAAGKIGAPLLGIIGTIITMLGIGGLVKRGKKFQKGNTSIHKPQAFKYRRGSGKIGGAAPWNPQ